MLPEKICKTVHQYSKIPIPAADMEKLLEIAEDYRKVKNDVYARYGGIGGLEKIYPGYTVQNEMTKSGLRESMGLPSVYFYLAVFEAVGDIKCQWTRTKSQLSELIGKNQGFSPDEKHYLRFLLKVNNAFEAVLNRKRPSGLPEEIGHQMEELAGKVDAECLNRYLCRMARRYHKRLDGNQDRKRDSGFTVGERGYRYGSDGKYQGIYISTKEQRKRVFVPLTDGNRYKSQLNIRLRPEKNGIEIDVPIYMVVRRHGDYENRVGLAMGMFTMFTTDAGHAYGKELGILQKEYVDWIRKRTGSYNRNRKNNPGRKKYFSQKNRYEERIHSYINHEINRFLQTEKPGIIYIAKLPGTHTAGINRRINHSASMWKRGYIRSRLEQKCRENAVELVEVMGKDIGKECSCCGAMGERREGMFLCTICSSCMEEKTNTARNVFHRGTMPDSLPMGRRSG